ncbi:MAG: Lsr2 family protein [Cellulomonadaceae bacterium]|nr:Lsr2 family protein [Cellulomonadaceae bacterium]
MAQRVQVLLVDDIDGTEATQTVAFALDGKAYELDLSDKNATALRGALDKYIPAARTVGGKGKASASRTRGPRRPESDAEAVRAWAKSTGMAVNERGRISAEVRSAYDAAHAAPAPAPSKGKAADKAEAPA